MPPFLVYWCNSPAPYMVDRFNALANMGFLEFEVWFNDRIETGRSWSINESTWRFRYRYLKTINVAGSVLHIPLQFFGKRRPDVIISLYAMPVFVLGWLVAKLRKVKVGFRVVKTFDSWVTRSPIKEMAKRVILSRIDFIETHGEDGKQFAILYGANPKKIYITTHCVDVSFYSSASAKYRAQKNKLRRKLDLKGTTYLYIGRLWWGKGILYLLEAYKAVQDQCNEQTSLLLVGDGPDEADILQKCYELKLRNVIFTGFIQKLELPKYYAISDVFVFPTLGDPYGLVIDEAMACSLPVISTNAAGEVYSRIEEGINGYVVPAGESNVLANRMLTLSLERSQRNLMGKKAFAKIRKRTPERWAEDIVRIVRSVS